MCARIAFVKGCDPSFCMLCVNCSVGVRVMKIVGNDDGNNDAERSNPFSSAREALPCDKCGGMGDLFNVEEQHVAVLSAKDALH